MTAPLFSRAQRFIVAWLALLPTLPFLSVLSLGSLHWRALPRQFQLIFAVMATTQMIAAALSPSPLLSLALAAGRLLLVLALIGAGHRLQTAQLRWALVGLGVVYVTAYADALLGQRSASLLTIRLLHPFLTPPSLGLAGAAGVLLAVAASGAALWWRLPVGLLALSVCVLSGSRSPLLGLLVGLLVILTARRRRWAALLVGGLAFLALTAAGTLSTNSVLERYASISNTDRDLIWNNTLSVIQPHLWSGVGPYQLGGFLQPPGQSCELWPSLTARGVGCPLAVQHLQGAWLIAHNLMLHQLAETGLIGTLGYALLLGLAVPLMLRSSLPVAGLSPLLLVASLVDNVLLVPSPFFAELFWIGLGMALREGATSGTPSAVLLAPTRLVLSACAVAGLYLYPLWTSLWPHPRPTTVQVVAASGARHWPRNQPYRVDVLLQGHGSYRVVLRGCLSSCRTLGMLPVNLDSVSSQPWDGWLEERLPTAPGRATRVLLELYPLNAPPFSIQPLARSSWLVDER
ncbi:O-antigen ligase family protein [Deinococcus sonorensis]|uniref:O-antigen ligase family protein n=2 Tax=Deinococcus sonorensis TaxID=309891 RepID=A0AAU7UFA2_9DEIO